MRKQVVAAALALTALTASAATDWVSIGKDKEGCVWDYDRFSLDADSVSGIVGVVLHVKLRTAEQNNNVTYNEVNYTDFFDCKKHEFTNAQTFFFSGATLVGSSHYTIDPWQPVLPGTVGMAMLKLVCHGGLNASL